MKPALITLLALPLAGCPALDIIEGKPSPYKAAHEQRMALVTPVVANEAPFDETQPALLLTDETGPEPECTDSVFRVSRCVDGKIYPWSM